MTDRVRKMAAATLIMTLLMLWGIASAAKDELPFGLQWGMTEAEVIDIFAAEGITLQYGKGDKAAVKSTVLYADGDGVPLLPDFPFLVNLNFFPLDAPGYNDGKLRLFSCSFSLYFDESVSIEEQQAKGKEIIKSISAIHGVQLDNETYCWRLEETEIYLLQFLKQNGSISLDYQELLSLRN